MEDEPEQVEIEIPPVTAPTLPHEIILHNSANWYQRLVGGGMALKFCPLVQTPGGWVPTTPGFVVEFGPEAWERFRAEVAADGVKSRIETHRTLPGGGLNGGMP